MQPSRAGRFVSVTYRQREFSQLLLFPDCSLWLKRRLKVLMTRETSNAETTTKRKGNHQENEGGKIGKGEKQECSFVTMSISQSLTSAITGKIFIDLLKFRNSSL
jgi:hypothetical protein